MTDEKLIAVCDHCWRASCWQGVAMCEEWPHTLPTRAPISQLRRLKLENESFWKTDEELQREKPHD
jgi:hypothetical protein